MFRLTRCPAVPLNVSVAFSPFVSMIALTDSLNRNVREFSRLHADELDVVEPGRLDPEAIERLIVVETVHADRLGEFEAVARNPRVEVVAFDHHEGETPDWLPPENLVV